MQRQSWKLQGGSWIAAVLSAGLLELPFPLAGPMPAWRSVFAWFGLAPLLLAILWPVGCARPLRRAFLLAYVCGVLWFAGNCYWIYDTMLLHGDLPPVASALLLLGFSLVLGGYFGLFGLGVMLVRRATGNVRLALAAAPFLWVAVELAGARITCVPWDQLGYSQVDNVLLTSLAPWTGVYGISFLLVAANALTAGGFLAPLRPAAAGQPWWRLRTLLGPEFWAAFAGLLIWFLFEGGESWAPPAPTPTATAVLVQPNLDVTADNDWDAAQWAAHIAEFNRLAHEDCKPYIAGIPQTAAPTVQPACPPNPAPADLIAWPEAPAPFVQADPGFQKALKSVSVAVQAPMVVGGIGTDYSDEDQAWRDYNSAMVIGQDGALVGRYDKIHLVPFGEYIPFERLIFFARKLTGRVSHFSRGTERKVFLLHTQNGQAHRYGVFICYEAVFADEVREFPELGAEVLVNISDDGWYGDTSAPWQHLNMARMRAIENRRWILRDTNTGITAAIDPYGRVRQSIPRHAVDALPAQFAFRDDVTFYTAHGDVFAWVCAALALGMVGWAARKLLRL
jgi:apolipoprotein N-acyltransferase